MNIRNEIEFLRTLPLFSDVSDEFLQIITFSAETLIFQPNQMIIRRGEKGDAAYLLVRGHANILDDQNTSNQTVQKIGRGTLVSDLSMIAPISHPVSVIAATEVTAKKISRQLFQKLIGEFPEFGTQVKNGLIQKLNRSLASIDEAADFIISAKC